MNLKLWEEEASGERQEPFYLASYSQWKLAQKPTTYINIAWASLKLMNTFLWKNVNMENPLSYFALSKKAMSSGLKAYPKPHLGTGKCQVGLSWGSSGLKGPEGLQPRKPKERKGGGWNSQVKFHHKLQRGNPGRIAWGSQHPSGIQVSVGEY